MHTETSRYLMIHESSKSSMDSQGRALESKWQICESSPSKQRPSQLPSNVASEMVCFQTIVVLKRLLLCPSSQSHLRSIGGILLQSVKPIQTRNQTTGYTQSKCSYFCTTTVDHVYSFAPRNRHWQDFRGMHLVHFWTGGDVTVVQRELWI